MNVNDDVRKRKKESSGKSNQSNSQIQSHQRRTDEYGHSNNMVNADVANAHTYISGQNQSHCNSSHGDSNNTCNVTVRPIKYGNRFDFRKVRIHLNNMNQFKDECEVRKCFGEALTLFLPHLKGNAFEMFVNKLGYDLKSFKILNCTFVVVFPCSINIKRFEHFMSCFLSKRGIKDNNG